MASGGRQSDDEQLSKAMSGMHIQLMDETDDYMYIKDAYFIKTHETFLFAVEYNVSAEQQPF